MKVAVVTESISHFEVPLFRLLTKQPKLSLKVFYKISPTRSETFDLDYCGPITWGEDLLGGYDSQHCADTKGMTSEILAWSPDVVLVYGYSWPGALRVMLTLRLRNTPLVFRGTLNSALDPRTRWLPRMRRVLRKPIFHLFSSLQYGGSFSYRVLRDALVPRERLFLVPYSVDSSFFVAAGDRERAAGARDRVRKELGLRAHDFVILFIGQLNWFKGPDIALDVFGAVYRSIPNARLVVVGDGSMRETLQSEAQRRWPESVVRFVGFCPSKMTTKYYVGADIALVTSRYETWARAVNEAMLCECPCVVNKITPSRELIENGRSGYTVDGNHPSDYAAAILTHSRLQHEERLAIGRAARSSALDMAYERHVPALVQSLEYAAARR